MIFPFSSIIFMVNWWFGLVAWIFGIPFMKGDCYLQVVPQKKNPIFTIPWVNFPIISQSFHKNFTIFLGGVKSSKILIRKPASSEALAPSLAKSWCQFQRLMSRFRDYLLRLVAKKTSRFAEVRVAGISVEKNSRGVLSRIFWVR